MTSAKETACPPPGMTNLGNDTGLPGEPHIDKTDVKESDQIGLTSFYYFVPSGEIDLRDDESLWKGFSPDSSLSRLRSSTTGRMPAKTETSSTGQDISRSWRETPSGSRSPSSTAAELVVGLTA